MISFFIATTTIAFAGEVFKNPERGMWSANGAYLWPGPTAIADLPAAGRQLRVTGPDGKTVLDVGDVEARLVFADGKQSSGFGIQSLAEVLWAPNASAFALTESDGGWVGTWSVRLAKLSPSGELRFHEISSRVTEDFYARVRKRQCPEYGNIGAIVWTKGAEELLLVAEAPPHSSCPVMTAVCGYVVGVPSGLIRRRLGLQALKKEWGEVLGSRLAWVKEADQSAAPSDEDVPIEIDCQDTLPRRGRPEALTQ